MLAQLLDVKFDTGAEGSEVPEIVNITVTSATEIAIDFNV